MQWGDRSTRTCTYDGGGGSNFCYFGAYVLTECPQKHSRIENYAIIEPEPTSTGTKAYQISQSPRFR